MLCSRLILSLTVVCLPLSAFACGAVASFLVIPILVIEKKGPLAALRDSTALLKKTWGEQLIGNFSFGLVFFLLSLPTALLFILAAVSANAGVVIACLSLIVLYLLALALVQSTLQSIFQTALYFYARDARVPASFRPELLRGAMTSRG